MRRAVVPFLAILLVSSAVALTLGLGDSSRPGKHRHVVAALQVDRATDPTPDLVAYLASVEREQVGEYLEARAGADLTVYLASIPPAPSGVVEPALPPAPAPEANWPTSLEPCGGDLPPCYVKARESGGDYNAQNPSSSASGAWQFLDSTWAGYGGYARAVYAPPAVQDAKARELWAGGAGCSHWSAC